MSEERHDRGPDGTGSADTGYGRTGEGYLGGLIPADQLGRVPVVGPWILRNRPFLSLQRAVGRAWTKVGEGAGTYGSERDTKSIDG